MGPEVIGRKGAFSPGIMDQTKEGTERTEEQTSQERGMKRGLERSKHVYRKQKKW